MRKNKEWEASFDGSKGNLFFEQVLHRIYYCISYEKRKALNAKIETLRCTNAHTVVMVLY